MAALEGDMLGTREVAVLGGHCTREVTEVAALEGDMLGTRELAVLERRLQYRGALVCKVTTRLGLRTSITEETLRSFFVLLC